MHNKTSSFLAFFERLRLRLLERDALLRNICGVLLVLAGLIVLLSLVGLNTGGLIANISDLLRRAAGLFGAILLCVSAIGLGLPLILNSLPVMTPGRWMQMIAFETAFFAFLALIHTLRFNDDAYQLVRSGEGGGAIGWVLAEAMWKLLRVDGTVGASAGRIISALIWFLALALAGYYAARPLLRGNPQITAALPTRQRPASRARDAARADARPIKGVQLPLRESANATPATEGPARVKPEAKTVKSPALPSGPAAPIKSAARIIKQDAPGTDKEQARKYVPRPDTLPPLDLLKRAKEVKGSDVDAQRQAGIIETTLAHFGLVGKVTEIRKGPTVTQYGVEPGYMEKSAGGGEVRRQKVRVGQIAALQNDFALALSAASIRIEAPIPGRALVGIEVPNSTVGAVDLRALMESDAFRKIGEKSPLAFALGKDVSGAPMCADLGRMPHLLIAGTTGSGKSVCISAITISLVMNNRPEDLKLVMIDPKMVELTRFAGLPHIIGKPESDMERIPGVLKWVVGEMERRYKKFAEIGARNLSDYNESMKRREEEPLPRMVLMIDELADLMMQSPIETEKMLCRLAQMARATGIHMVVATQRPSVDVVTGLIKANFPARLSFAVASSMDSRVILDQVGAESLLGRGDMLFLNPETGSPMRIQGCFVSDREVEQVMKWWKATVESEADAKAEKSAAARPARKGAAGTPGEPEYVANKKPVMETPWDMVVAQMASERAQNSAGKGGSGGAEMDGGDDDLIQKSMEIIRNQGSVSTSLLQRKLRIGYPRAARLMEELQEMGYVGGKSSTPTKGREVKARPADEDQDEE